jgi:DNA-directed RNA polymerase specialized sigma subunit
MTREDLIVLLKEYKENKARLNIKLKELKNSRIKLKYVDSDTNMTSSYGNNQDIHSKNQISDKVSRKVEENDTKRIELENKIEELEEEVRKLREKVDTVEDRLEGLKFKEREILTAYYVEGMTAEDIGNRLYFQLFSQTRSGRHIQRIIEKATEKMVKL